MPWNFSSWTDSSEKWVVDAASSSDRPAQAVAIGLASVIFVINFVSQRAPFVVSTFPYVRMGMMRVRQTKTPPFGEVSKVCALVR